MKKIFYAFILTITVSVGLSFLILFEGDINQVSKWWEKWSINSSTLPFSPYKKRRENSSLLEFQSANKIQIYDERLFWKGNGAVAHPEISNQGELIKIIVINDGSGYSKNVKAEVVGANSAEFELGKCEVIDGKVQNIEIIKSAKWSLEPLAYIKGEDQPFSGTIQTKFDSGQIIEETKFLSGKIHGKNIKYDRSGIPVADRDYISGKKHGTHIFWYPKPIDPSDYIPQRSSDGDLLPTLWTFMHSKAKEKFGKEYGSHESNQWVVKNYRLKGGSFQLKLLEHWHQNLKHGLFEGFDELSNKKFKDEYSYGKRIKHQIFDKQK